MYDEFLSLVLIITAILIPIDLQIIFEFTKLQLDKKFLRDHSIKLHQYHSGLILVTIFLFFALLNSSVALIFDSIPFGMEQYPFLLNMIILPLLIGIWGSAVSIIGFSLGFVRKDLFYYMLIFAFILLLIYLFLIFLL